MRNCLHKTALLASSKELDKTPPPVLDLLILYGKPSIQSKPLSNRLFSILKLERSRKDITNSNNIMAIILEQQCGDNDCDEPQPHTTSTNRSSTSSSHDEEETLSTSLENSEGEDDRGPSRLSAISSCSSSSSTGKRVVFGAIQIHVHAYALGDNPSAQLGPPVTVAWESFETIQFAQVDDYEKLRGDTRSTYQMLIPRNVREYLLRAQGYSQQEMNEARRAASKVRRQRNRSSRDGVVKRRIDHCCAKLFSTKEAATTKRQERVCSLRIDEGADCVPGSRDPLSYAHT